MARGEIVTTTGTTGESVTRETIAISCDDCTIGPSEACEDCLVTFVLDHEEGQALVFDVDEARALHLLSSAGLVPSLRHSRRAS